MRPIASQPAPRRCPVKPEFRSSWNACSKVCSGRRKIAAARANFIVGAGMGSGHRALALSLSSYTSGRKGAPPAEGSMLILVLMLLIGIFAAIWGFMACFLPVQWDRLTQKISFAENWSEASPKRQHPVFRLVMRLGQSAGGLVICAVGCWFAYLAASGIYRVLAGRATTHTAPPVAGALSNSPTPALNALSAFVIIAGVLMAVFPAKAVAVFEHIWPAGRSVAPSAAPKVMLFVRLSGRVLRLPCAYVFAALSHWVKVKTGPCFAWGRLAHPLKLSPERTLAPKGGPVEIQSGCCRP